MLASWRVINLDLEFLSRDKQGALRDIAREYEPGARWESHCTKMSREVEGSEDERSSVSHHLLALLRVGLLDYCRTVA